MSQYIETETDPKVLTRPNEGWLIEKLKMNVRDKTIGIWDERVT